MFSLGPVLVLSTVMAGCGTYDELSPGARAVTATSVRPSKKCQTLGNITGKGGGASGGYVSNESLIEYAINDLRNQAAELGATHVVYSSPTMGGNAGTTTSAMVMGEALRCAKGEDAPGPAKPIDAPTVAGCQYDTQCKGNRVCVDGKCVAPSPDTADDASAAHHAKAAESE